MTSRRRYRTTVALEYFERSFPVGTICSAATRHQIVSLLGRLPRRRTTDPANVMRWAVHDGEYSCVFFAGDLWFRLVPTSQMEKIDD